MLLFFDIDGTLWDYKNWIPDTTKEGIRRAKENGHKCFINSGRARSFISNKELLGLGFDGIVSAGGCMIEKDGEIIFNRLIDSEDAIRTVETVRKYGFKAQLRTILAVLIITPILILGVYMYIPLNFLHQFHSSSPTQSNHLFYLYL